MTERLEAGAHGDGSVKKALAWAGFGQFGYFILQFGSSVILAHLLSPREMGIFAVGTAAVSFVSAIQALGLNNYLIQVKQLDRHILSTVFTVNIALSSLVSLSILVVGIVAANLFKEPGTLDVMLWMASTPVLGAIGLVPQALLQREGNFRLLSLLRIFSTLAGTILTVTLAFLGFSYMSLAYGWVVTTAISMLGACAIAPRHVHWRLGFAQWRDVSRFGMGMVVVNGTTQAQRQLLNLVLGHFQGLAAVGLFSRANNLYSMLIENTQTVAMRVFLVDFANAARRGEPLADRYHKVVELMTALLWPLFAGLAVISGPVILFLYGPMWVELKIPLALLCLSALPWISVAMAWELFVVANETDRQAKLEVARTGIGSICFLAGAQFSLTAACFGKIAETISAFLLYRPHVNRITQSRTADLLPVYMRSGISTLAAVAPAMLLMMSFHWSPFTPLAFVGLAIALGGILWIATLFLLKHTLAMNLRTVLVSRVTHGKGSPT